MAFSPAFIPTILKADSTTSALIGTSPIRCYPMILPANPTLPAITYNQVGRTSKRGFGLETERWQVDCWATSYSASYALSQAVWNALQTYNGKLSGVRIEDVRMLNQVSTYEVETKYYRHMLEFRTVTL